MACVDMPLLLTDFLPMLFASKLFLKWPNEGWTDLKAGSHRSDKISLMWTLVGRCFLRTS